jgi:hypothetical protein
MKNILKAYLLVLACCLLWSCDDKYDDTRIWEDLDEIENIIRDHEAKVQTLEQQMTSLTSLLNSSFISLITQDAAGNFVISYSNNGGDTHTVTIAKQSDVVALPIVSAKMDSDGKYYWAQSDDKGKTYSFILDENGEKYAIGGRMPEVGIDNNGYWTINGESTGVLAKDMTNTLFREAYIDEETEEAVFILSNNEELRFQLKEALGLKFNASLFNGVADYNTPVTIGYEVYGTLANNAYVDLFTAYNMEVTIDRVTSTLTATMKNGATEGNILLLASAGNSTILKPIYFTFGEAVIQDPLYQGSANVIQLTGNSTSIEIQVSSSISYQTETDNDWITYSGTRAITSTTHAFEVAANETGNERSGRIIFSNALYDISTSIDVKQDPKEAEAKGGIGTAADLVAFANAVNSGASTARWQNTSGEVVLLNDIDMAGVNNWQPIGGVDASAYTTTEPYVGVNPFTGTFNGQGFAIKNLNLSTEVSADQLAYGLFGSTLNATIKNLVLGSPSESVTWRFTGTAARYTVIAPLIGYAKGSIVENCTNYYNIDFVGDNKNGELVMLSGLIGATAETRVGGDSRAVGATNRGFVRTGAITNTANGGTGMQTAGIVAFMAKTENNIINYCVNYGDISSPSGRTGGLVATLMQGNIYNSDNRGTIEDDRVGQHADKEMAQTYNLKRMGGLVGGTDDLTGRPQFTIEYCTNYGNVITYLSARTGGFVGHSNIQIIGCVNRGAILGDVFTEGNGTNKHGPGWACGFSGASSATWTNVRGCARGGYVGGLQYKDDPTSAPEATNDNAFCHANNRFDPSINF